MNKTVCNKIFQLFLLATLWSLSACSTQPPANTAVTDNPSSENSMYPKLFTDNTGTVFMSWMEQSGKLHTLKYSSFQKDTWTAPQTIAADSTWFINWADYLAIIARNGKPMAAHWLNKVLGGTYAYHINMATFNGRWTEPFTPHNDGTPTEHGFLSMVPASDSTFAALWLDGRQTHDRAEDEYSNIEKAMTLRAAFLNTNGEITDRFLVDESVCDCCNTALAKTDNGYIAAYRDRTEMEIRDIYISRYENGSWSEGRPVHADNWEIAACPVNGPAIDASGNTVAVAWFTGAEGKPVVKMALSQDYGNRFESPIILDNKSPLGRVDLNIAGDRVWVSWLTSNEGNGLLHVEAYDFNGKKQKSRQISGISRDRSAGFPQITPFNGGLMVAYTDISGEAPRVTTVILN